MYLNTGINDSPTIVGKSTDAIVNGAFLAAKFDGAGGIVLAGAGENAIGLLIATTPEAVAAGAELTADANGAAVTATTGKYATAIALEAAAAPGAVIKVQIVKSGKIPA